MAGEFTHTFLQPSHSASLYFPHGDTNLCPGLHFVHSVHLSKRVSQYVWEGHSHRMFEVLVHAALSCFCPPHLVVHEMQEALLLGLEVKVFGGQLWHWLGVLWSHSVTIKEPAGQY